MLKKQTYHPRSIAPHHITRVSQMMEQSMDERGSRTEGWRWRRYQLCRSESFSLVAVEGYFTGPGSVAYMNQEDYIKVNFLLTGRRSTILDGFGQYDNDRSAVFITS